MSSGAKGAGANGAGARGDGGVGRTLARQALAEFLGTGLLVALVVGSGIMAQRLSTHDTGLQLLENSTASELLTA